MKIKYEGTTYTTLDLMPKQSQEVYDELEADICELGRVYLPVFVDEHGGVIDGGTRLEIAAKHGIEGVPIVLMSGMSEEEKRRMAFSLSKRRSLSPAERREWIATLLKVNPAVSNRQVAAAVGASPTTVQAVRSELESTVQIGQLTERTGKDGRTRPSVNQTKPAVLCERCQRVGAVDGCKDCVEASKAAKALAKAEKEATKAAEKLATEKAKAETNGHIPPPKPPKAGKPKFDDKPIEEYFGKLTRLIHERSHAHGKGGDYENCLDKLNTALMAWRQWQAKAK